MKNLSIATEIFVRHAHDHYNFLQNFVMVVCIFHWLIKVWWILNYKLFTSLELYFAFIYLNFNICGCTYLLMKTLYLTAYQMNFIKKKWRKNSVQYNVTTSDSFLKQWVDFTHQLGCFEERLKCAVLSLRMFLEKLHYTRQQKLEAWNALACL